MQYLNSKKFFRQALMLLGGLLIFPSFPGHADWSLVDGARVHPDYRGPTPKKSAVVFSSRSKRPDAIDQIRAFGATRVEWVYSFDPDFTAALKRETGWFGGSLNANIPLDSDAGMAKDFDGNTLVHPRMKAWGGKWNTTTHPETQRATWSRTTRYLDLGVDSIQFDDPLLQLYSAYLWGGDFNPSTLAGFDNYLKNHPNQDALAVHGLAGMRGDYREFLIQRHAVKDAKDYARRRHTFPSTKIWIEYLQHSVIQHFTDLRRHMNTTRGSVVPLSMNLGNLNRPDENQWHFFLASLADYAMAETPINKTSELQMRALTARALGIGFVPSLKPLSIARNRVAIATLYALGAVPIVPWDVYTGNDETGQPKRVFGTQEEYGDLYRFVRTNAELFDNLEQTAVIGIPVPVDNFDKVAVDAVADKLFQRRIPFAFILAGGRERKFAIDAARATQPKLLLLVNSDADFNVANRRALHSLPVPPITADLLSNSMLQSLSPFIVAGNAVDLKLYPRARAIAEPNRLVVHVVDEARGEPGPVDPGCKHRIGIKKSFLGNRDLRSVTWNAGAESVLLDLSDSPTAIFFTVPHCGLWGVLTISLV